MGSWCSDAVAPQKHDAMASLKLDVSQGIAARIARSCTHTLTFTQPAASLLVQDPPQAGGLLAGVAGGLAGSSGEPVNRWAHVTSFKHVLPMYNLTVFLACIAYVLQLQVTAISMHPRCSAFG